MDAQDQAPDSWEQEADDAAASFSRLSVNARPFVPNVNAPVFIPSFLKPSEETPGEGAEVLYEDVCSGSLENGDLEGSTIEKGWENPVEQMSTEPNRRAPDTSPDDVESSAMQVTSAADEEEADNTKKVPTKIPEGPLKEHVNVVFIGHYEREAKEKNRETWCVSIPFVLMHIVLLILCFHASTDGVTGGIMFLDCPSVRTNVKWFKVSLWCRVHRGLPFIPYLEGLPSLNRPTHGPTRLPIVDKYRDMGTVVLGKLESGSIAKGQHLIMMPNKHTVEVLSMLSDEVETDLVGPGENLKLRLKGIEEEEILPGFVLCEPGNVCHTGCTFDVVIIEHKSIICPGYNAVLHIHSCVEEVQIEALICLVDKKSGEKCPTRPRFVKQDQVCIARFKASGSICLETFKEFPQMGRFTLRDEGKIRCYLSS
uniref:G1 to S phase transition 2 n=1 Tax=Eptatretus burgeri TaxID=7764 RepID=A0A8C4NH35_EPTBU